MSACVSRIESMAHERNKQTNKICVCVWKENFKDFKGTRKNNQQPDKQPFLTPVFVQMIHCMLCHTCIHFLVRFGHARVEQR